MDSPTGSSDKLDFINYKHTLKHQLTQAAEVRVQPRLAAYYLARFASTGILPEARKNAIIIKKIYK